MHFCIYVCVCVYVCAKSFQSCLTLFCDPLHHSPPGSSFHGILQARILKWFPCSPLEDLPNPGIRFKSLCLWQWQAVSLLLKPPRKPIYMYTYTDTHTHTYAHLCSFLIIELTILKIPPSTMVTYPMGLNCSFFFNLCNFI